MNPMHESRDHDPQETQEWIEALEAVVAHDGPARARFLLSRLLDAAGPAGALPPAPIVTDYVNTIPPSAEAAYPGDLTLERRITNINRWNAAVMVSKANKGFPGVGGHISTYASSANLLQVGFFHFFRGKDAPGRGDQVYLQGHSSPGIYAQSFLEGRMTEEQLLRFRREVERGRGLSSYPHPRLMPDYWEFPTVSMGLGPIGAIYQARFNKYLHARGIKDTTGNRVWCFIGDGEMDEPESRGALSIAAREELDNLVFVVNCNLQRLDGPVRGNGKIIQELEGVFRGNGWNVLKVLWGSEWDGLFSRDTDGHLVRALNSVVDGEWQKYAAEQGSYTRERFFGQHPALLELVAHLEDLAIQDITRGGHDPQKIFAAYAAAVARTGVPTVVLAHTVKGFGLGEGFEARNATHQKKKLDIRDLRAFRDELELPITDDELEQEPFYHPGPDSEEVRYLRERREALGGPIPERRVRLNVPAELPGPDLYAEFAEGTGVGEVSTTMAFVRLLTKLLKDGKMGPRIVPIVPDEARTFGMDALFRQVGIYAPHGQQYEPIDRKMLLYYREAKDGQLLEEGITEAGSMASFTAAGTAYATHGEPMFPFYIFYSMFGFQRTGDQAWQFGDIRGRGFLLGATAGRTTLTGEGLQHDDGQSLVLAATFPNLLAYEPAYAYELALIVREGLRRMWEVGEDVFYYVTLQNENYRMPPMSEGVEEGVIRGLYRFRPAIGGRSNRIQIFGSGSILGQALSAAEILGERFDVDADVWSATSYQQLRADALACERWNMLHPESEPRVPWVRSVLEGVEGPFLAVSDWMRLVPDQIARWVPGAYVVLGTDGFGLSDTREALRRHFEIDPAMIAYAALASLACEGRFDRERLIEARAALDIDPDRPDPLLL